MLFYDEFPRATQKRRSISRERSRGARYSIHWRKLKFALTITVIAIASTSTARNAADDAARTKRAMNLSSLS